MLFNWRLTIINVKNLQDSMTFVNLSLNLSLKSMDSSSLMKKSIAMKSGIVKKYSGIEQSPQLDIKEFCIPLCQIYPQRVTSSLECSTEIFSFFTNTFQTIAQQVADVQVLFHIRNYKKFYLNYYRCIN